MAKDQSWTKKDCIQIATMVIITVVLSIRKGPFFDAFLLTLRHLATYFIYGLAMVYIIVGLTKKIWKYNPTRIQIIKWAIGLSVFFAINQMIHEAFLTITGQIKP